jgi:hypothetical protein
MEWLSRLSKGILPWKKGKDCCSFWPDGNWQDFCCQHDDDYKYGEVSKWEADKYLREGVIASGHTKTAWVMWAGVTVFGWLPWLKHRIVNKKREQ